MVDSPSGRGPSGGGSLRDVALLLLLLFPLQMLGQIVVQKAREWPKAAPRKELVQRKRMPARLPARLSVALEKARH